MLKWIKRKLAGGNLAPPAASSSSAPPPAPAKPVPTVTLKRKKKPVELRPGMVVALSGTRYKVTGRNGRRIHLRQLIG